jgi:hypothetical protein
MKTWNRFRPCLEELEGRIVPSTLTYSSNWSGYAVTTGADAVSQVAGSWTVPSVSRNVSGYSSAWVGIDGFNSSSVEQIGTDSDYVNGTAHYYAWYEMYPSGSVNLGLTIRPGDTISASVNYTGLNQFTLSITDVSTGNSFSTTQASSQAQRSSAEWIQEAPSSTFGVLPLANFSTINFSGANANVSGTTGPANNSWSGSTLYQIDMATRNGALKATTSPLTDSGSPSTSSFSVTFDSSGSGGKGGGHKSVNVAQSDSSDTTAFLSAAVPSLTASPQGTPPAFVANQSPTATVGASAAVASSTAPALSTLHTTTAPFVFVQGPANSDGRSAEEAETPELPFPREYVPPSEGGSAPKPDGPSIRQADPTSAKPLGGSLETGRATDANNADGIRPSAASVEGAPAALNEGHEGQYLALAGLVLILSVDPRRSERYAGTDRKKPKWPEIDPR